MFFVGFAVVMLAIPQVAATIEARAAAPDVAAEPDYGGLSGQLEWIGLDAPATEKDLRILERELALEGAHGSA